ncbi:MAG: DnaD domain protein [Lachnospiraceae bacterium]|nr:DnaD domain protein [Lachnospiraceae bacterium]MBP3579301.1 DnaD domain protein [Lachnospiraceae bacterium]
MSTISLNTERKFSATVVPNLFIDRYMPSANGSYVKVYLYLLRCLSGAAKPFTLSTAADALDETEKDIIRALSYWEKNKVVSLIKENESLTGITLLDLNVEPSLPQPSELAAGTVISIEKYRRESRPEVTPEDPYKRPVYTETQLEALRQGGDMSMILDAIEVYLGRLLTPQDLSLVAFLSDKLGFSGDLILHLYEYCIDKNKKKWEYIEKVAISWHQEGIDSVEKAQEYSVMYDTCFNVVNKVFSLGRMPIGPERDFIRKWSSWKLPTELLEEACNRTIMNISKPDFKYTDRILESWHKAGATTLAEVKALDTTHALMNPRPTATDGSVRPAVPMTKSAGSYNSYPQRQYSSQELSSLEEKLLKQM